MNLYTLADLREMNVTDGRRGASDVYSELLRRQKLCTASVAVEAQDPEDKDEKKRLKSNPHHRASTLTQVKGGADAKQSTDHTKRLREVMQI